MFRALLADVCSIRGRKILPGKVEKNYFLAIGKVCTQYVKIAIVSGKIVVAVLGVGDF